AYEFGDEDGTMHLIECGGWTGKVSVLIYRYVLKSECRSFFWESISITVSVINGALVEKGRCWTDYQFVRMSPSIQLHELFHANHLVNIINWPCLVYTPVAASWIWYLLCGCVKSNPANTFSLSVEGFPSNRPRIALNGCFRKIESCQVSHFAKASPGFR
ncbi:hypothetical protein CLF_101898, partial [Clonorchis sinensis]